MSRVSSSIKSQSVVFFSLEVGSYKFLLRGTVLYTLDDDAAVKVTRVYSAESDSGITFSDFEALYGNTLSLPKKELRNMEDVKWTKW